MIKVNKYFIFFCCIVGAVIIFTIEVSAQARIRIRGTANPNLTISTGIAGGQPIDDVNTGSSLRYTTPRNPRRQWKITVSTDCPGQSFSISVIAINVSRGTAEPEVTLTSGNPAIDLITDIPRNIRNATADLQYTASTTFEQGHSGDVGNDIHTVTYTLQLE